MGCITLRIGEFALEIPGQARDDTKATLVVPETQRVIRDLQDRLVE
jgi:hypothetical protein